MHRGNRLPNLARLVLASVVAIGLTPNLRAQPVTPDTIKRMSSESEAEFQKRKERITFGTPENQRYCREVLEINVGLCKGGSSSACFYTGIYRRMCVLAGDDGDAAVAKIRPVNRDDYFDYRSGEWWSRARYCSWYADQRVRGRNLQSARANYEKNCGDLPLPNR